VRRRPVRIADGRMEGGYTGVFELICPGCGDHPYLDFREVPLELQWLRGPYVLAAALAAYEEHIGPSSCPNGTEPESLGPASAKESAIPTSGSRNPSGVQTSLPATPT
jgi:hypothetical protein